MDNKEKNKIDINDTFLTPIMIPCRTSSMAAANFVYNHSTDNGTLNKYSDRILYNMIINSYEEKVQLLVHYTVNQFVLAIQANSSETRKRVKLELLNFFIYGLQNNNHIFNSAYKRMLNLFYRETTLETNNDVVVLAGSLAGIVTNAIGLFCMMNGHLYQLEMDKEESYYKDLYNYSFYLMNMLKMEIMTGYSRLGSCVTKEYTEPDHMASAIAEAFNHAVEVYDALSTESK